MKIIMEKDQTNREDTLVLNHFNTLNGTLKTTQSLLCLIVLQKVIYTDLFYIYGKGEICASNMCSCIVD